MRTGADAGVHAWQRSIVGWHLVFALLLVLTGGLVLAEGGGAVAVGLVLALGAWYAATGARAVNRDAPRLAVAYVAVAVPLTITVYALVPVGALLLFALFPQVWAMLRTGAAIAANVALLAGIALVLLAGNDWRLSNVDSWLVPVAVGFVVALAIGLWITRIIRQSQDRADLLAELAAARAELARVSHEAGALAERGRLARDIHDTVAQGFASVVLLLEAADAAIGDTGAGSAARAHMARARATAQECLAESRSVVAALSPPQLVGATLPEALRQLVDRLGGEFGVDFSLAVTGAPRGLGADREVVLLRATQEALANARRHAVATRVEVALGYEPDLVRLCVTDDGRGFDPAVDTGGFGLAGVRDRVAQVGGSVTIRTAAGTGTSLRLELPA